MITEQITDNDHIINIVSWMNPYLFSGLNGVRYSADYAIGHDWRELTKSMGLNNTSNISNDQAFDIMVKFLEFYQKEFEFTMIEELEKLKQIQKNPQQYNTEWSIWENCCTRALNEKINFKLTTS